LLSYTGLDGFNAIRPGEVKVEQVFESSAPTNSVILGLGHAPFARLTYRYRELRFVSVPILRGTSAAGLVSNAAEFYGGTGNVYVETSESALYYEQLQGLATPAQYRQIVAAFVSSPQWRLLVNTPSAQLFVRT
jgi:hypothetical protein